MAWKGKKVLIAGGAGMIGSHLGRRLVKIGANVTIADNLSSGSKQNIKDYIKDVEFHKIDMRLLSNCKRMTKGKDVVVNLSANMGGIGWITEKHAEIMSDSGIINHFMLKANHINDVPLYFFSSSACVYSELKQRDANVVPLKEEDAYPALPDLSYGWEKLFAEQMCLAYMQDFDMNIRIARFHNIYGDGYTSYDEAKSKAPCKMILRAIQYPEKKIEIWNDGNQTRSFCYVEDCIDAVIKLLESNYKQPINIGTDHLISMNDLAKLVREISGKKMDFVRFPDKPQGVRGRNADLTLCKKVLKWQPKMPLKEGMTQVYKWAVEHYNELEGI